MTSHLKTPTPQAEAVFALTLANNPNADMRAIPTEWLLRERATTVSVADKLEDRIAELEREVEALRKELDGLKALLAVAKCPEENCVDGSIAWQFIDGNGCPDWEQQQCQWCYERGAAIGLPEGEK